MAGFLNNSSCGFAKVTVHLCNVNKPFFKNGNKDEILDIYFRFKKRKSFEDFVSVLRKKQFFYYIF